MVLLDHGYSVRAAHTCTYINCSFGFLQRVQLVWGCAACQPGALSRLSSCETHSIVIKDEGGPISPSRPMALSNTHTHAHTAKWHLPVNKQHAAAGHGSGSSLPPLTLMAYVPHALVLSSGSGEQTSWESQDTWWLPGRMLPGPEGTPFNSSRDESCCRLFFCLTGNRYYSSSNTKTTTRITLSYKVPTHGKSKSTIWHNNFGM